MKHFLIAIGAVIVVIVAFFAYRHAAVAPVTSDAVHVTSPAAGAVITSPLMITGEARGTWFFQASLPVMLLDANRAAVMNAGGMEVAAVAAQADGEWMTEDFVPFSATIPFTAPATNAGFLVVSKDNPSGLPENDMSVEIPVRFR